MKYAVRFSGHGATGVAYERRSTSIPVAGRATPGQTQRRTSRMGASLPSARYADTRIEPAAQAAWQSAAKRRQILRHGGGFGTGQGSFLACQDHEHRLPALAQKKYAAEKPVSGRLAKW